MGGWDVHETLGFGFTHTVLLDEAGHGYVPGLSDGHQDLRWVGWLGGRLRKSAREKSIDTPH